MSFLEISRWDQILPCFMGGSKSQDLHSRAMPFGQFITS